VNSAVGHQEHANIWLYTHIYTAKCTFLSWQWWINRR